MGIIPYVVEEEAMKPAHNPDHDMTDEEESDLSPKDQHTEDEKNYKEHLKQQEGNPL
jgi:hypothetical protein